MRTKIFIGAIFLFVITGCLCVKPLKTSQIPDNAKWIGGKDGGSWISVQIIDNKIIKIDVYGVYYDKTSELLGNFTYNVVCKEYKVTSKKVLQAILFSDGLNIEWNHKKKIVQCLNKK